MRSSASWYVVDAEAKTLGRLATQIADVLRGKRKAAYTPHVDTGDFVIVVNAEKIHVTGQKLDQKIYYRHSGYPGGLRERTLREQLDRRPEEVLRKAVKGMLPKNRLASRPAAQAQDLRGPRASARGPEPRTPAGALVADTAVSYRGTGKRKTSVARVLLVPGAGAITVNGKTIEEYFPRQTLRSIATAPLALTGTDAAYDVRARIDGGGISGQAGALRHGISRALIGVDENLRTELKKQGFLTRDDRQVERKKAGLKKARKRPQFSKR